jgi:hypothetical protein
VLPFCKQYLVVSAGIIQKGGGEREEGRGGRERMGEEGGVRKRGRQRMEREWNSHQSDGRKISGGGIPKERERDGARRERDRERK